MSPNSTSLIVGGSSGIGLAVARRLMNRNIGTILLGRDMAKLSAAKEELSELGPVDTAAIDLHDLTQTQAFVEQLDPDSRHIKYLVNATGIFSPLTYFDHTTADFDKYHTINRWLFFITQAVAKNMRQNSGGAIVNIGSMWAHQAVKATPSSAYSMAKAGLHALTQHLAMELADVNIQVNAVAPAVVATPIYGEFLDPNNIDDELAGFAAFHPVGRIGQATDAASVIDFILSDDSSCETGRSDERFAGEHFGLVRPLLIAGARRVLASQWKLDDVSSVRIFRDLYVRLAASTCHPAESIAQELAAVQTDAAQLGEHPALWGGLVAVGSW